MTQPQSPRMVAELELIRRKYPNAVYEVDTNGMEWVMVPDYPLPKEIWGRDKAHVAVKVHPAAYPANYPYGFYVKGPMQLLSGQPVGNYTPVSEPVPFPGQWGVFSWYIENWNPHADVEKGNNLARFIDSFAERLREGA